MRSVLSVLLLAAVVTSMDIVDLAQELGASTLVGALQTAGLESTLRGAGPFTVFGPTNEAFDKLPEMITAAIEENPSLLSDILLFHVLAGQVMSSDLSNDLLAPSLNGDGDKIRANIYMVDGEQVITAAGSKVIMADQMAENGVIHVVDHVLIPPMGTLVAAAQANEKLSTLVDLVVAAGLVDALEVPENEPVTIFAPSNDAFEMAEDLDPTNIMAVTRVLKYHAVAMTAYSAGLSNGQQLMPMNMDVGPLFISRVGDKVYVNDAMVMSADETASNGVIHVLSKALSPPGGDLVDLAIAAGFSSLVEAIQAADLVSVLEGGPYTAFAPTNDAFERADIDMGDMEMLKKVLKYHVVPAVAYSFSLMDGQKIPTLMGDEITVSIGEGVMLNGMANVIETDVQATNGVIHIIDTVLMPRMDGDMGPIGSASGLVGSLALTLLSAIWCLL